MAFSWGECPICRSFGRLTDEHAITRWTNHYLTQYGPFLSADGNRLSQTPDELTFPLCEPCNNRLNRHFENPARDYLKSLFSAPVLRLDHNQYELIDGRCLTG